MDRLWLAGRGDLDDDQAMAIAVEEVRAVGRGARRVNAAPNEAALPSRANGSRMLPPAC